MSLARLLGDQDKRAEAHDAIRARAFPSAFLLLTSRSHPAVPSKYDNL
jgi:hypothetical protein